MAAVFGVSALIAQSPATMLTIRYVGGLYVSYIGFKILRSSTHVGIQPSRVSTSLARIARQGFVTSLLNPKLALFFLAFLPQFVDPRRGTVTGQLLFFRGLIVGMSTCWNAGVAYLAGGAAATMQRSQFGRLQRMLLALGVRLLLAY